MPAELSPKQNGASKKEKQNTNGGSNAAAPPARKRKRASPFRIKVGCVVAFRFRPDLMQQNNCPITVVDEVTEEKNEGDVPTEQRSETKAASHQIVWDDDWVWVWTNPLAGRDEGLALIGKRIRCFFPRNPSADSSGSKARRVLEGEVIRVLDYEKQSIKKIKVELLIDQSVYEQHFSFLPQSDKDDLTPSKQEHNKTARRNVDLETRIRGRNKVCVVVPLMKPWWMETRGTGGSSKNKSLRWAIQKLVPARLFRQKQPQMRLPSVATAVLPKVSDDGESPQAKNESAATVFTSAAAKGTVNHAENTESNRVENGVPESTMIKRKGSNDMTEPTKKRRKTASGFVSTSVRHVGDGNDSPEQQMNNWRWISSRYHDILLSRRSSSSSSLSAEVLSCGFIALVEKVEPTSSSNIGSSTLAMVTLQRMFLPEQTSGGRLSQHGSIDVFADYDRKNSRLKVPIEHLVIVGRKLEHRLNSSIESSSVGDDVLGKLIASDSYSLEMNGYLPPATVENGTDDDEFCHRCRRRLQSNDKKYQNDTSDNNRRMMTLFCASCKDSKEFVNPSGMVDSDCFCLKCQHSLDDRDDELFVALSRSPPDYSGESESIFTRAAKAVQSTPEQPFMLPFEYLAPSSLPAPAAKPITKVKKKPSRKERRFSTSVSTSRNDMNKEYNGTNGLRKNVASPSLESGNVLPKPQRDAEDYSTFKPTCARTFSYESGTKNKKIFLTQSSLPVSKDKPRNMRETGEESNVGETDRDEKSLSGRAARANQRRVLKDVASFGATASLAIDTLASREPQLRFDRSGIHAWGVFADEDITAGEMIVEYRGELIGNSMSEKREKEYEAAKIGSDYMFRIDAFNVCDATKQGNVARFINASCEPNCFTKIITLDGNKRIVIYAKRNIRAGEELCYDYKFPLEYDESKRIPCHCGAKECRGFMNWDKRYVALPGGTPKGSPVKQDPVRISDAAGFAVRGA